jgi:hypothetical protein
MMAVLAHHVPVAGKLPCLVRIFHQMAAVAELGVLLDIIVIADREDDPKGRNDQQKRDNNGFVPRAQAPLKFIKYFGNEFEH